MKRIIYASAISFVLLSGMIGFLSSCAMGPHDRRETRQGTRVEERTEERMERRRDAFD